MNFINEEELNSFRIIENQIKLEEEQNNLPPKISNPIENKVTEESADDEVPEPRDFLSSVILKTDQIVDSLEKSLER